MTLWSELQADPWMVMPLVNGALLLLLLAHGLVRWTEGGRGGEGEDDWD